MVTDLGLDGVQWNIVLSVFFVPYILLEIPSNMLLKRFKRPSYYLGILIVCWGIVMTMMGVVKNFAGLLATRILLGVFEFVHTQPIRCDLADTLTERAFSQAQFTSAHFGTCQRTLPPESPTSTAHLLFQALSAEFSPHVSLRWMALADTKGES
jgi:MFS family permease